LLKGDNLISKLRTNNPKQGGVIPQAIPNDIPVAYLSFDDLARYVLAALGKPELKGNPIGGSEALTRVGLAEQLGQILGKSIRY
jgi:NAD(P)H dehydrogenase (quinone)